MAAQKAVTAWIAGGVAVAALAVGYGVGRTGDGAAAPVAEQVEAAAEDASQFAADGGAPATEPVEISVEAPAATAGTRSSRLAASPPPALRATAPEPLHEAHDETVEPDPEPFAARVEEAPPVVAEPEPRVTSATIAAGTPLRLRLATAASSQASAAGDVVTAELVEPVYAGERIALPAGARIRGRVVEAVPLRKIGGRASLALTFERAVADLETVEIRADWARTGKSETGKDAATIAAGAAAGTIVGNQAKKNDRGKILGGLIGAGIGAAVASRTPGEAIELPAGTVLEVELAAPVRVTVEVE